MRGNSGAKADVSVAGRAVARFRRVFGEDLVQRFHRAGDGSKVGLLQIGNTVGEEIGGEFQGRSEFAPAGRRESENVFAPVFWINLPRGEADAHESVDQLRCRREREGKESRDVAKHDAVVSPEEGEGPDRGRGKPGAPWRRA